jgi:hypothetical protein
MERKKSLQMNLSELEYDILDECYFINSYEEIWLAVQCDKEEFKKIILSLLDRELIQQLLYNEKHNDYDKQEEYNRDMIEAAKYVITKKGLMLHNGREL